MAFLPEDAMPYIIFIFYDGIMAAT